MWCAAGCCALLETEDGIQVVGEAADGVEAVLKARALNPDVILLDLVMPRKSGIEAIQEIKMENTEARILVLTSFSDDDKVFAAIKSGALGYLLKDSSDAGTAGSHPRCVSWRVFAAPSHCAQADPRAEQAGLPTCRPRRSRLPDREVEVLVFVARGYSNQEIADALVISERTVRTHVSNILSKLHLANRTQAALYALKEGLADLGRGWQHR